MFLKMPSVKISNNSKGNNKERVSLEKCSFAGMEGLHLRMEEAFLDVFPVPLACNFIKKETLAQAFPSEFCEIFKNNFFTEHLRTATSEIVVFWSWASLKHFLNSLHISWMNILKS